MSEVKAKCKIIHDFALSIIDEIKIKNKGAEWMRIGSYPLVKWLGHLLSQFLNIET